MLRGEARYVADLELPGLCEVAFVRSTVAHAVIRSIDTSEARTAPGVLAVYTASELTGLTPLTDLLEVSSHKTPRPALANGKVRYVGEPVVCIVAEDRYLAEDAAERVLIEYDPLPAIVDVDAARRPDAALLHDNVPDNTYFERQATFGDVDAAFAAAHGVYTKRLRINRHFANSLEGRAICAQVDPVSGDLTCWMSTQAPFQLRFMLSMALGLPESSLRVVAPQVGGAFGPKDFAFGEDICTAYAAHRLGRPVRWIEDRVESLMAGPHAKEQDVEVVIAIDEQGHIVGMRGHFASDTGAFAYSAISGLVDVQFAAHGLPGPYRVENYAYESRGVLTNKPPVAPYRGVGFTAAQTVRELLLDEIAHDLGIDRVEIRRRNLLDDAPTTSCTGMEYDGGSYTRSLELAVEAMGEATTRRTDDRRLRGVGYSPFVEMTTMGARSGTQGGVNVLSHDNAEIRLDLTGRFTVSVGTCSHGQGHRTAFAQLAADALGVGLDEVTIVDGDTATTPWGMGTFASRSAVFASGAIRAAAAALREKLFAVASALMEANPAGLEMRPGAVGVEGVPEAQIPLADLAQATHFGPGRDILDDPSLVGRGFYDAKPTYSNGCLAVEVAVDEDTFAVEITNVVAVEDCGTMLNPTIVEGQMRGGFLQGVGAALLENYVFDEDGQPLTTTYLDYHLPRSTDAPTLDARHLVTPSPTNETGAKGMAEGTSIAAPAAILNAIADALSARGYVVDELPYRPTAAWRQLVAGGTG